MAITIKLEGADNLKTKLRSWLNNSRKDVGAAVAETLLEIESDAKRYAPVDKGLLRSSIAANVEGKYAGSVTANANYAIHVEYGTWKMKPQPFLRPAFANNKAKFLARLKAALKYK